MINNGNSLLATAISPSTGSCHPSYAENSMFITLPSRIRQTSRIFSKLSDGRSPPAPPAEMEMEEWRPRLFTTRLPGGDSPPTKPCCTLVHALFLACSCACGMSTRTRVRRAVSTARGTSPVSPSLLIPMCDVARLLCWLPLVRLAIGESCCG